ncbi:MAG TPA: ATP-binding protein [Hanamia sp.]|nr:ATP-binding protein [Hanamia sp.]
MPANFSAKLNDLSIRNKLILMQVFTSVLVLSIVFTVFVVTDIKGYKQRKIDSITSLAQLVGTNNISTLQFQDTDAATEILDELHNMSPEIVYASILDKNGNIFATYSRFNDSLHPRPVFGEKRFEFSGEHLFINNPIISNNEVIGKVLLEVELSELKQIRQSKYELSAILLLVALAFSFLIAFGIQSYISKRLLRLVNTMKRVIKTGELDKLELDNGKDEISTLNMVFNKLMLQIKESQERKDEFIGIASHELKTPLTTVKGYIDLLTLMEHAQPQKLYVQKAQDNLKKLENLIKDLLDVSKIQSGQLELNITEFDIDGLLDETIAALQMVTPSHDIIRKGIRGNHLIRADRQRLEQVLINLLSNAVKYSPGEKEVLVYCELTEKELIINIRDFGNGVPAEEQTNIFERFYRAKELSVYVSGFGLGLYICRDIINRHNGRIGVESGGKVSVFYFSLPLNAGLVNKK